MKINFLELDNDKILLLCDNIDTISKLLNLDIKENKYLFFIKIVYQNIHIFKS